MGFSYKVLVVAFICSFIGIDRSQAQTGNCAQAQSFGVLNNPSLNCGGEPASRFISASSTFWTPPSGPGTPDVIEVFVNWGDGSPLELIPLNFAAGVWTTTAFHTFPDNGPQCVYNGVAVLVVNGNQCTLIPALTAVFDVVIFDELDNNNIGTHIIEHDATSTGVDNGNIVEVCQGDTMPVRFIDESEFNCTDANLIDVVNGTDNRNREARWVQYEYGTTSNITGDVIIGGVTVTPAMLPYHGPVFYIGDDPDAPLDREVTLDIQMPATALVGEQFEVTLRSWNVCNPYDDNLFDGDELNPVGGAFDVSVDLPFPPQPFAIEDPIEISHFIEIIETPIPPTPVPRIICNGTDLTTVNFEIVLPGASTEINWYDADPTLGGATELVNPINDNSTIFPATAFVPPIDNSVPGVYSLWATYIQAGINDCESAPVQVDITIRPDLPQPGAIVGDSEVCSDDLGEVYQLLTPPEPDAEYVWFLTGTGPGTTAIQGAAPFTGTSITIDFDETGVFTSRTLTLNVFQRFTDLNPACNTDTTRFDIQVSGGPQAIVVGGGNVCSGNPAADIVFESLVQNR